VSRTVAVPVETLEAIVKGLHDAVFASSRVAMEVDDIIASLQPTTRQETPATLAPVVRLADYRRKARGGAA